MKTDKELRSGGPPSTYDWTMRSTFRSCPRKLYFFLRGLDYANTPPYFTFGKAWQATLDQWYDPQVGEDWLPDSIVQHYLRALEGGRKVWAEDGVEGFTPNDCATMELLFQHYVSTYPLEPFKVIGTEKGWEWPFRDTPYYLGGSLDGYIEWSPYGVLVMENKTTGLYLGDQFLKQWNFSGQVTQYTWYLVQLMGEEIFGCLMNMASKRIPKTKAPTNLFARDLQKRSPFQLEEFEQGVLLDIQDIEREWDRWAWPKTLNPIECVGGIGRAPCLFQPLCLTEAHPWELDPSTWAREGITSRDGDWCPWKRG